MGSLEVARSSCVCSATYSRFRWPRRTGWFLAASSLAQTSQVERGQDTITALPSNCCPSSRLDVVGGSDLGRVGGVLCGRGAFGSIVIVLCWGRQAQSAAACVCPSIQAVALKSGDMNRSSYPDVLGAHSLHMQIHGKYILGGRLPTVLCTGMHSYLRVFNIINIAQS